MMGYGVIVGLAIVFYKIGDSDYFNKRWLLALLSVVFSIGGGMTGLGLIGMCAANLLLFLLCLGYNLIAKKPPGSSSGW